MTTCRDIIQAAYEELGALGGNAPTAADSAIGMRRLTALMNGLAGMGIGEPLKDLVVDTETTDALPINTRAVVTTGGLTIYLPDEPCDGTRIQVIDAGADFSGDSVTIDRNGRLLEGSAANITAATEGYSRTWFYRADLADWTYWDEALALEDTFPFPAATEDAFAIILAYRLSPSNGLAMTAESQAALQRAASTLRTRYRQTRVVYAEPAALRLGRQAFGGYER